MSAQRKKKVYVAGARRDDAAGPFLVGEAGHPVVGAAQLEAGCRSSRFSRMVLASRCESRGARSSGVSRAKSYTRLVRMSWSSRSTRGRGEEPDTVVARALWHQVAS